MSTSLSLRAAHGRWLIALSALLVAPACGREDDPTSPTGSAAGVDFAQVSVEDPSQVAGALRALGIDPPVDEPSSLQRGTSALPAHLLWPLGELRREGLASYRVDLDLAAFASAGSASATLRFRDGNTVLSQEPIAADAWSVVKPLPAAVLEAATKGNVITWGLVLSDRKSKPIEGTFKVIEKAQVSRKLTELADDKRLARSPVLLSLAQAQVLENYSLLAEALPLYVELSGRDRLDRTGFAGVARCLQRLGSHQKQLGLRESHLYQMALEQKAPQKGTGAAAPPTETGPGAGGPIAPGSGKIDDTPEATAAAGGPKRVPGPGGAVPSGAGGIMPASPNALPTTPPAEGPDTPTQPSAGADDSLLGRAAQVLTAHADRLAKRAMADANVLQLAREQAEQAAQQALLSQLAADTAEKRLEDAKAARHQPSPPGTEPGPMDMEKLKAFKEAADAARRLAETDEAKAKAAQDAVRLAVEAEAAANTAAREQRDLVRRLGHGPLGTPPGGQPSGPAPGGVPTGGVPPGGTPGIPPPGTPPAPLTPLSLEALTAAIAKSQAGAEASLKDASDALEAALAARGADPSAANVQAVKDARAELEQAQKALDQANALAARLLREADGAGTHPR